MHNDTVASLLRGLQQKTYSSVELTRAYLERIEQLDAQLNAFITVDAEAALAQAAQADAVPAAPLTANQADAVAEPATASQRPITPIALPPEPRKR